MNFFEVIQSLFKNNPNNIMIWSRSEKRLLYHNSCIVKELGYSQSDSCSCSLFDFQKIINPLHQSEFAELLQNNMTKNCKLSHLSLIDADGKNRLFNFTCYGMDAFPDYKVIELSKVQTLKSSQSSDYLLEDDLKSIISLQTDGIGILDENELFRYSNTTANKIFGTYPNSLIGRDLKEFLSFRSIEFIKSETAKRKHGESSLYELQILRDDNIPCFILVTATPKFDEEGNFIETIGIFRDITDKKKAEEQILLEQNKIKSVLNSLQDMIFIFDSEGYFIDYLQSDKSKLLTPPELFVGKNLKDVLPPSVANLQMQAIKKINKTNKSQQYDYPIQFNNKTLWYSAQISKIEGSIFYKDLYIGVVRDISHRKKNEEKLKANTVALEQFNNEKNKLISIMAHDLKNPFSAMLGMAEMLNKFYDSFSEDKKREYVEKILLSTKNIQYLLENTLQWSLNEQNRIQFSPEKVDFYVMLEKLTAGLQVLCNQKEIKIVNNIPTKTILFCDEQMMRNIFINLITNAIKFSFAKGKIEFNYKKTDGFHTFSIVDYGVGISKELSKTLFSKRFRNSQKGTQGESGTGLGLMLCKEFVQKHNGKIWVESVPNEKTEFFVMIPESK